MSHSTPTLNMTTARMTQVHAALHSSHMLKVGTSTSTHRQPNILAFTLRRARATSMTWLLLVTLQILSMLEIGPGSHTRAVSVVYRALIGPINSDISNIWGRTRKPMEVLSSPRLTIGVQTRSCTRRFQRSTITPIVHEESVLHRRHKL